jgi:hypothetical protein
MADSAKMKSVDLVIPPLRKIKKKLNKKIRASRKTRVAPPVTTATPITSGAAGGGGASGTSHHSAKTMKRVVFNPDKNQIFEYQCAKINSLDDLDVNFSLEPSAEFKIEEVPDINIADLFNE